LEITLDADKVKTEESKWTYFEAIIDKFIKNQPV